jgi:HD-GYP domain-containing protein (c-di-GMP phosphodiesterase class II)
MQQAKTDGSGSKQTDDGEILLHSGVVLREPYIVKLEEMGYHGIYIQDNLSEDIIVSDLIDQNLRFECIKSIKDAYSLISKEKTITTKIVKKLGSLLDKIIDTILSSSELLVNIIDLKDHDNYTFYHSVDVTILSLCIGTITLMDRNALYKLGMSALLHDIGKVFIPKEILNKNSYLSDVEFNRIKTHPYKGYQLLKENNSFPYRSSIGVLHHHEKYNGTGYPFKLEADKISLLGRIIAVADVYSALTSDRPYRKALFPSEAMEYIMGGGDTLFDPDIVKCFAKIIAPYPVGTSILLSNNTTGIVVKNYQDCCMRPKVKIVRHGDCFVTPYYIDLKYDSNARNIVISGIADI